jgi:hypothetical protein
MSFAHTPPQVEGGALAQGMAQSLAIPYLPYVLPQKHWLPY